jgi:predicted nucleotidyltransferase
MQTAQSVSHVLERVRDWAASQPTIAGVALVGSHARGEARADSDIDLVLLCTPPQAYVCDVTTEIRLYGILQRQMLFFGSPCTSEITVAK